MKTNAPKEARYALVRKKVEDKGWTMLTPLSDFKNQRVKISVKCPKGHIISILPYHFIERSQPSEAFVHKKFGLGCSSCSGQNKTIDELKEFASNVGWKCISPSYKTKKYRYEWLCPKGHKSKHTFHVFSRNQACKECNEKVYPRKYFEEFAISKGGRVLSVRQEFYSGYSLVWFECSEGHNFRATIKIAQKHWCRVCE